MSVLVWDSWWAEYGFVVLGAVKRLIFDGEPPSSSTGKRVVAVKKCSLWAGWRESFRATSR